MHTFYEEVFLVFVLLRVRKGEKVFQICSPHSTTADKNSGGGDGGTDSDKS